MKILMVLTSHDQLGNTGEKTGFWLEEFAAPFYVFKDAGAEVVLASPKGGHPPLDPKSDLAEFQTQATRRFGADTTVQTLLASTHELSQISADAFDGLFYPGGHGPLWDLTENGHSLALIEKFISDGKPVAAVCHAPTVLLKVRTSNGAFLLRGRQVTGFSNDEEKAVGLAEIVPFLLEDEMKARGAEYSKGADWSPHEVVDGLLITGQNPASSEETAKALLNALEN
jgi:putative intracellular protease/amidase